MTRLFGWLERRLGQGEPEAELPVPDLGRRSDFTFDLWGWVDLAGGKLVQWGYAESGLVNAVRVRYGGDKYAEVDQVDLATSNIDLGDCDLESQREFIGELRAIHAGKKVAGPYVVDEWRGPEGAVFIWRRFIGTVLVSVTFIGYSEPEANDLMHRFTCWPCGIT